MDTWLLRLKAAYEAGYYKTEAPVDEQIALPWSTQTDKRCTSWLTRAALPPPEADARRSSPQDAEVGASLASDATPASGPPLQTVTERRPTETFLRRCVRLLGW
jgi:hypothetical protein